MYALFVLSVHVYYVNWKSGDILNAKQNTQRTIALCKAQQKKKTFLQ
jgi:hypothetical protein